MSIDQKSKISKLIVLVLGIILIALIGFFVYKIYTTKYIVTFSNEDNSVIETRKVNNGGKVITPADPQKEGYDFVGWYYGGKPFDFNTKIKSNITIFAKWKIDSDYVFSYVVSFDSNGGSAVEYQVVESGKGAIKPTNPIKNGHVFAGWQLDNVDYNFETPVTKDIKLVAKWEVALTADQASLATAREEVQNFSVTVANQTLKSTAASGKCSITWINANFSEVVRDTSNKQITVVANISCGTANAQKSVVATIPASTYKYSISKQSNTTYKFIAYDGNNELKDYNLFSSNIQLIQKWQNHKDGNYLQIGSSKYVKNGTYYLAFQDDENTKYAITIK